MKKTNSIAIRLTNVSKKYEIHHEKPTLVEKFVKGSNETFWALKNINLTIKKGGKVGIIGPNGSGKTTLLKIIAGITTPTSGDVKTYGKVVSLIDLEAGFHPDLTGVQNIFLGGMLMGLSKKIIQQRLSSIIAFADIRQFIDVPLYAYSEGMKLRLGFSVAAYSYPDVLIIDEVISVGDQNFKSKCLRFINRTEGKITYVFSTHDFGLLARVCDRSLLLNQGRVINTEWETQLVFIQALPTGDLFTAQAQSDSMYPTIKQNDVLQIKKIPFSEIGTGDIISFYLPNISQVIVHRVINVTSSKGVKRCYTKGDNTFSLDSWEITKERYLGKIVQIGRNKFQ